MLNQFINNQSNRSNMFNNQSKLLFNNQSKLFNNQSKFNNHQSEVNQELNMFLMKNQLWNMKPSKELNMSQLKEKSPITMQLNIKLNIFLKFIKKDILNISHKKELLKELNTKPLKDRLFNNQSNRSNMFNNQSKLFNNQSKLSNMSNNQSNNQSNMFHNQSNKSNMLNH